MNGRAGFTLVEVMIAVGVMTVGSLGILAMHRAVTEGNRNGREMTTAMAITETWLERIERDALSWNSAGINAAALGNTQYLSALQDQVGSTGWILRNPVDPAESSAFDFFGNDVAPGNAKYCVNLQLTWVRQGEAIRADVRTFWYREGRMPGDPADANWVPGANFRGAVCGAAQATGWETNAAPNINFLYASTVVRWISRNPS